MNRSITIAYDDALPSVLSKNGRAGANRWVVAKATAKLRAAGQELILEAMQNAGIDRPRDEDPPVFAKAHFTITNYWVETHQLDDDGLAAASAALVDAFKDMDIISDDNPRVVTREYRGGAGFRVPHMDQRRVTVTVTEVLQRPEPSD